MKLSDVADRETISVEEAGAILGLRRSAAYEAARRGQIPTLTLGRRKLVSVRRLAAILGADWSPKPVAADANPQVEPGTDGSEAGRTDRNTHSDLEKPARTNTTEGADLDLLEREAD